MTPESLSDQVGARAMLRGSSPLSDSTRAMAVLHLVDGRAEEVYCHFDMSVSGTEKTSHLEGPRARTRGSLR